MTVTVQVRDATAADADAVAALGASAFARTYDGMFEPSIIAAVVEQTYTPDAVRSCIERAAGDVEAHFLVAELEERVVGYLDFDSRGTEPELHRIYVDPAVIGGGIGTQLLEELHRRLAPAATYILMVAAENLRAVRFYERHGFAVDAEVDGVAFYREHMGVQFAPDASPVPSLVMRQTLAGD